MDTCLKSHMLSKVMHVKWNYQGSLLAITSKDKKLHVVDPRQSKIACAVKICDGPKPTKVDARLSPMGFTVVCHRFGHGFFMAFHGFYGFLHICMKSRT